MDASKRTSDDGTFLARLRREMLRRCAGDARYSLRAFARDLGLDHSTLSQILRGRRRLTAATVRRLGRKLKHDGAAIERDALAASLACQHETARLRLAREVTADAARALEEWPHLAILELTRLPEFEPDSRFIARVLGLGVDEVNVALQRLLRLGLLEMAGRARWVDHSGGGGADAFARATLRQLLRRLRALSEADR